MLLTLTAAERRLAISAAAPGSYEISRVPAAGPPLHQCMADVLALARIEHRGQNCTHVVISNDASSTVIHYTCPNAGFGRSKLTMITPRSLRIETQGFSGGYPFNYVVHARRTGDCRLH